MKKYSFRSKSGKFTKPNKRSRLFNENGQEIFGAVKNAIVDSIRKQKKQKPKRQPAPQKQKPKKRKSPTPRPKTKSKFNGAKPRDLNKTFGWHVENINNAPDSSTRQVYAVISISDENVYGNLANLGKDDVIAIQLPQRTAGAYKKMDEAQIMQLAMMSYQGDGNIEKVRSIVIKKTRAQLSKNSHNNPLVKARIKSARDNRKRESKKNKKAR